MLQCWQTWLLRYATNKVDYFSMQCIISHRVWLSLIIYSTTFQKKCLQISNIFSSFKGNIIWTCTVLPGMSPFVEFISFAKNVAIDFCYFFLSYWGYCFYWNYEIKNIGHSACLRENGHLFYCQAWPEGNLILCMHTCSSTLTNDAKIVRNRDVQCNSEGSP